jgi:hypothetical protein
MGSIMNKLKIILLISLICLIVAPVLSIPVGDQITAKSEELWNFTHSSENINHYDYPYMVHWWVTGTTKYQIHTGMWVNSSERTWQNHVGICTEFALLYEQMLSRYMPATIVYGYYPSTGVRHATVKYIALNGTAHYIDGVDQQGFVQLGYGLGPGEYVVGSEE